MTPACFLVEGRIELRDHSLTIGGRGDQSRGDRLSRHGSRCRDRQHHCQRDRYLRETGSVHGDISVPRFAMSDGGVLSGRVDTQRANATAHADERRSFSVAV
jgi:hypothetical protein